MHEFLILFTTKATKSTKKVKERISVMIAFSFVSFGAPGQAWCV